MEPVERGVDFLEHYGVKGMKWGVRKVETGADATFRSRYKDLRTRELRSYSATTKNGETVTAKETREWKVGSAISALSPKLYKSVTEGANVDFVVDGRKVGDGSFEKRSKDEMYLNWIGVKPSERGKGYASAMFDTGVAYSKDQGVSKLTLEVPGNAPDARHIYEKRGFKASGPMEGEPDDMWGGLTPMTLDISDNEVRHADEEALELERAFLQHFGVLYQGLNPFEGGETMGHIDRAEDFLEHYGVKGMKWGVKGGASKSGSKGSFKRSTPEPSEDKKATNAVKAKVSKGNTDALSNAELKKLNERMQLEQNYSNLTTKTKQTSAGKAFLIKTTSNIMKQQVQKATNDYVGKQVASALAKKK